MGSQLLAKRVGSLLVALATLVRCHGFVWTGKGA